MGRGHRVDRCGRVPRTSRVLEFVDRGLPPKPRELAKAIKQTRAQFAYSTERVSSLAYLLGVLECLHSYRDLDIFTERLAAVTPQDVQRVAQTYLRKTNRTVGWFQPVNSAR